MLTAAEIMTRDLVVVYPETPVREVAELLSAQRFGAVPVVQRMDRVVVGIVTEEDMVRRVAEIHLPRHLTFLGGILYLEDPRVFQQEAEKILATTAGEVMETEIAYVAPETPVDEVATRMLRDDLRRLLVVDAGQKLLGIITRADIVRMTAQRAPGSG